MSFRCDKVLQPPLRPAHSEEEYQLHLAALEWSLADCIVIQSTDDIQSRASWRDHLEPYHHQVQNLFTFCRRLPVTLLADDVGLGKTISAGLILSELMARKKVRRALVLCPKILCEQWVEELNAKFGILGRTAIGKDLDQELRCGAAVVVTTYQSATDRLGDSLQGAFDMLVLDEAHKLRNLHGGYKPPKLATSVHEALRKRLFKFVVMLTATPIQNRLWDLYSLLEYLAVAKGHKNPLGSPDEFEMRYLLPRSSGRALQPANAEAFRRVLRQYVVRTRRGDTQLSFPVREVKIVEIGLSAEEWRLVTLVSRKIEALKKLNRLEQTSLLQALMSSPAALATQLENMAERNPLLAESALEARRLSDACTEPAKLKQLLSLCDELKACRPDWRVVVFTHRKETQQTIGNALAGRRMPFGFIEGGKAAENQRTIERFRSDPPGVRVLVSTDAGAEGINLQVANVLVNYDLPWNPMIVEQRIGRLQRLGSLHATVVIFNLVAACSTEGQVVVRLLAKLQGIAQALGDIESILESAGWGDDQTSFEEVIRDLVVRSLEGQDVDEAARKADASIQQAKMQLINQEKELNKTLGTLTELHDSGPTMPRFRRLSPAVAARDLVERACKAKKAEVRKTDHADVIEVWMPGQPHPERIAFDARIAESLSGQAVFMGKVKVYEPGKAEFERLVQHWVDFCGHFVCDRRDKTAAEADELARAWCLALPDGNFLGCKITRREARFQGHVRVKVKASNGVDGYEKLVEGEFREAGHSEVQFTADQADRVVKEVRADEVVAGCEAVVKQAVEVDADIAEFCRFYEARLAEEKERAGDDDRLRHKIVGDFAPAVVADVVGLRGVRYDEVWLCVRFSIGGEGEYEAVLRAVPAVGRVLEEPGRETCGHTGARVPAGCLAACQVTSKRVLRHLLTTSEATGRCGLRSRLVTCHLTHKRAFDDEVAASAVSNTVALKTEFVICQESGAQVLRTEAAESASGKVVRKDLLSASQKPPYRLGLAREFDVCQETSRRLLKDELDRSAFSGKLVDRALLVKSDASRRLALQVELVTCQDSQVRLLPDETGVCCLTNQTVDARLLKTSEVSGRTALARLMKRCVVTGSLVLPCELEQCQETQAWALPSELALCAVTKKRALKSLIVQCQQTLAPILATESGVSDYSRKTVRRDLLYPSARPPHRLGLVGEFGRCRETRHDLLLDELATCTVSGLVVDRTLLRPSARSGALALPKCLVRCPETKTDLLPSETGLCEETKKVVDDRLLAVCQVTNRTALRRLMDQCHATRKLVLRRLLKQCELTSLLALPTEFETCVVTGKRAIRGELLRSDVSGRYAVPQKAVRSAVSRKVGLLDEVVRCAWLEGAVLKAEAKGCTLTNKVVGGTLLNADGELTVLRRLLDGDSEFGEPADDLIPRIRSLDKPFFRNLQRVWVVRSPQGGKMAVCCEVSRWWGMQARFVGFLLRVGEEFRITGQGVIGYRKRRSWVLEQELEFPDRSS